MPLIVPIAIAILLALIRSAGVIGTSKRVNGELIFAPSKALRATLFFAGLLFLWLGMGFLYKLGFREGWLAIVFFVLAVFEIANWPSTIRVNQLQIMEARPFRAPRVIEKTSVSAVTFDSVSGETTVYSDSGVEITHRNHHVGSVAFRNAIGRWKQVEELRQEQPI